MEGLVEVHFSKIMSSEKASFFMAKFYWELFKLPPNKDDIALMGKLINIYGKKLVFDSLLDMTNVKNISHENIYPLLFKICRVNFDKNNKVLPQQLLDSTIKEMRKKVMAGRSRKIRANSLDE